MEHLPSVSNPYEPIQIPYLGGSEYDGLNFAGYPERQSWNTDRLLQGDLQGRTATEASQFLQTWLYFGMLHEALRIEDTDIAHLGVFVRLDVATQQRFITTSVLNDVMSAWLQRIQAYPDAPDEGQRKNSVQSITKLAPAYYQRFRATMKTACGVWRLLMQPPTPELAALKLLSDEILLSIEVLGAALDCGVTEICGSRTEYSWRINPRSEWLMKRMVKQGWCACIVEQLSRPCRTFLYYASLLGPPKPQVDHSGCSSEEGAVCTMGNVRDDTYVPQHIEDGCECDAIAVDTGDESLVAAAIRRGDIPVIKISIDAASDSVRVEVDYYSDDHQTSYIAISHVWVDGLGDPRGNTLPKCQLKRMAKLVEDLPTHTEPMERNGTYPSKWPPNPNSYTATHIWLDTLCVPVNNQDLRQQAIVKMRDVYKYASKVLVINDELVRYSANATYHEIFTRITSSTWLRRLWTLQEATMNKNLLFQFAEGAVYVGQNSQLFQQQAADNMARPWDMVAWECNRYNFDYLNNFPHWDLMTQTCMIWNSLKSRTTSKVKDMTICVSILQGLDVAELQKEPGACTVKKFFSLHKNGIPVSALFLQGPKLEDEGFTWAPRDLSNLKLMGAKMKLRADVTPEGLCATLGGIELLEPLKCPINSIIPFEIGGAKYFIKPILRGGSPSWEGLNVFERRGLCLVLLDIDDNGSSYVEEEYGIGVLAEGFSASHTTNEGFAKVKYLRLVSFVKENSFLDRHPNIPWTDIQIMEKKMVEPVKAKDLGKEQKWCVG